MLSAEAVIYKGGGANETVLGYLNLRLGDTLEAFPELAQVQQQ